MAVKIQCPSCGRSLTVSEADAGHVVMCSACGNRLTVPPAAPPQTSEPAVETDRRFAARQTISKNWWDEQTAASAPRPARKPVFITPEDPPIQMDSAARAAWIGLAIFCVVLLVIATRFAIKMQPAPSPVVTVAPVPTPASVLPPAWNSQVRRDTVAQIREADALAIQGRLREAAALYISAERKASTQPAPDAGLKAILEGASDRHADVATRLAMSAPATTTTAPTPVTVVVRTPPVIPPMPPATRPVAQVGGLRVSKPDLPPAELNDERIGQAITGGVNFLLRHFDPNTHQLLGRPSNHKSFGDKNGLNALCVYALLQAGEALPNDERIDPRKANMREMLNALDKLEMEERIETYGRGLRATALALANRKEDRATLQADVAWLMSTHKAGAYGYGDNPASKGGPWDNSNTQYGQLGVWSAADVGIEVSPSYWMQVQKHWNSNQNDDGTWTYNVPEGRGTVSMTCAGLASLFVAHDYIDISPESAVKVGRAPFPPALAKALAWFERDNNAINVGSGMSQGYTLYGIERVGLASGLKFFGQHDWYRELARQTLNRQSSEGSWGDPIETSYALLFLSRGRHPIMMNKLRFEGAWANRPRDVANLARFATHELERPLNWQVVSVDRDFESWSDAPILYLASHEAVHLTNVQVGQIRRYVEAGGMLFTHADAGSKAFNDFAAELAGRLFPEQGEKPLQPVPSDHDLYSVLYNVDPKPPLQMVTNGVRVLMIHSPTDITSAWQQRVAASHPAQFKLGVNLFLYAAGKGEMRNRLVSTILPQPPPATGGHIAMARLKYGPDATLPWDPEPAAWPRFASWFTFQTSCAVDLSPVPIEELKPTTASIAHLTGARAYDFSDSDIQTLRQYVDSGGTLLIDCAGGSAAFADSVTRLLGRAFPDQPLRPLPRSHPILASGPPGMDDLAQPLLRPFALHKLGPQGGINAIEFLPHGKGRVIYTGLDLTAGLLGTRSWGILGFEPAYSQALVKNIVLWVAAGAKDKARPATTTSAHR